MTRTECFIFVFFPGQIQRRDLSVHPNLNAIVSPTEDKRHSHLKRKNRKIKKKCKHQYGASTKEGHTIAYFRVAAWHILWVRLTNLFQRGKVLFFSSLSSSFVSQISDVGQICHLFYPYINVATVLVLFSRQHSYPQRYAYWVHPKPPPLILFCSYGDSEANNTMMWMSAQCSRLIYFIRGSVLHLRLNLIRRKALG